MGVGPPRRALVARAGPALMGTPAPRPSSACRPGAPVPGGLFRLSHRCARAQKGNRRRRFRLPRRRIYLSLGILSWLGAAWRVDDTFGAAAAAAQPQLHGRFLGWRGAHRESPRAHSKPFTAWHAATRPDAPPLVGPPGGVSLGTPDGVPGLPSGTCDAAATHSWLGARAAGLRPPRQVHPRGCGAAGGVGQSAHTGGAPSTPLAPVWGVPDFGARLVAPVLSRGPSHPCSP